MQAFIPAENATIADCWKNELFYEIDEGGIVKIIPLIQLRSNRIYLSKGRTKWSQSIKLLIFNKMTSRLPPMVPLFEKMDLEAGHPPINQPW
jgi:hypothetical protein